MELAGAAPIFLLIWFVLVARDLDNAVPMTIVTLPFGMFALLSVGGMSLLASSVFGGMAVGFAIAVRIFGPTRRVMRRILLMPGTIAFAAFTIYGAFSAIVLVRIFQGRFLIYTLNASLDGVRASPYYSSVILPLTPNSSNIAQTLYVTLSFAFFVTAAAWFASRPIQDGERVIRIAVIIHLTLALLDLLMLDNVLAFVRTAGYQLANEHQMGFLPRLIGGYSEASAFGSASAAFFGYFTFASLHRKDLRDGLFAGLSLLCVMLSFSATGYVGAAAVFLLLFVRSLRGLLEPQDSSWFLGVFATLVTCAAILSLAMLYAPFRDFAYLVFEKLFITKGESVSGIERADWARSGINAFFETNGLGAGVGSLRSNGLIPVLLGSVGLPGTLAFFAFVGFTIRNIKSQNPEKLGMFEAARAAVIASIACAMVSGTTPDLGLMFATFAAVCMAMRMPKFARDVSSGIERRQTPSVLVPRS